MDDSTMQTMTAAEEMVAASFEGRSRCSGALPPIRRAPPGSSAPLSLQQEALMRVLDEWGYENPLLNLFLAMRVGGRLDASALGRSLNEVVRRHEALRTTFPAGSPAPRQVVGEARQVGLPMTDLSRLPAGERDSEALRLARVNVRHIFDLSRDLLLSANLLRLGDEEHYLTVTTHHLVSDGWSLNILLREIWLLYEAFAGENRAWISRRRRSARAGWRALTTPLPEPALQYRDFAYWQRSLPKNVVEEQLSYWRRQLQGNSLIPLPDGKRVTPKPSPRGEHGTCTLPTKLCSQLKELSRREGATLFMTLLSAFYVLLYLYTGQEDLVLDTPAVNRNRIESEGVVGFFASSLFLRADVSGNPTFRELLGRTRRTTLDAYEHQDVHSSQVMKTAAIDRFQVMFAVEAKRGSGGRKVGGLDLEPLPLRAGETLRQGISLRDLAIRWWESGDELIGSVSYRTELFDAATIARMLRDFEAILEAVVRDPGRRLRELVPSG